MFNPIASTYNYFMGEDHIQAFNQMGCKVQKERKEKGKIWQKNGELNNLDWTVVAYSEYINRIQDQPYGASIDGFTLESANEYDKVTAFLEYIFPNCIPHEYKEQQLKWYDDSCEPDQKKRRLSKELQIADK